MLGFFIGWWRARAARPLLWWVLALLLYALLPVPQHLVLFLIVGLGVALTVTVRRLREGGRQAVEGAARAWDIADRLSTAVEDRIRHTNPPHVQTPYYGQAVPQIAPMTPVYDPGALLSAVVAVLAAEGLSVNAAPALPACGQLLTWQGIALAPGAPAPTARALATGLVPGAPRRYRAAPVGMLAACIAAVLVSDGVLPVQITTDDAEALIEGAALILDALGIAPDPRAGQVGAWPVMAQIINTAPQGHQHGSW
jgi:hypothetical protein